jgi:protein-disulfide isomerase
MATTSRLRPIAHVPAGASADGTGIVLGSGPVTIDAYVDFLCPFCKMFEERCGDELDAFVQAGTISLVYHPLGFLDRLSTTRYSTRASAASGCAADGGRFREFARALFDHQPPEGGPGLSDSELVQIGLTVGFDHGFEACVAAGRYLEWAELVTAVAVARRVSGTPTVLVEGVPVPADPRAIASAVSRLAAGS